MAQHVALLMEGDRVTKLRPGLRLAFYRVQAPLAGDALELVLTAVFEGQPGAGDQILDRARDEHLAGLGIGSDPGAGVHGDAGHLAVHQLALARVQADTDFQSELGHRFSDGATAADGACRPVEGGEEAVPRSVHLLAPEAHEVATDELVVALQELAPAAARS
jgi:hypothetical protein